VKHKIKRGKDIKKRLDNLKCIYNKG